MQEIEKVRKESVSSLTNIPVVKISPANIYTSLQSTAGAGGHGGFFLGTPPFPSETLTFRRGGPLVEKEGRRWWEGETWKKKGRGSPRE